MIQHVAFKCRDVDASEAFYTKHLGFRRVRTFNPGEANEFIMLRRDATCIELFRAQDGEAKAGPQPVGFQHLAFEVDDLDGALEGLQAASVATEKVIDLSHLVAGFRVCFFIDPDGNRLELMEGYADESA